MSNVSRPCVSRDPYGSRDDEYTSAGHFLSHPSTQRCRRTMGKRRVPSHQMGSPSSASVEVRTVHRNMDRRSRVILPEPILHLTFKGSRQESAESRIEFDTRLLWLERSTNYERVYHGALYRISKGKGAEG